MTNLAINGADTAWVLASGALVLLMTPALALFYGGLVRTKSTLNMMMMSFSAIGVGTIVWILWAYSLAFGPDTGQGIIGDLSHFGLNGTLDTSVGAQDHQIPTLAFVMFQMTFAIITVALLSGAIADRAKFGAWIVFIAAWITLIYAPVAHWAFASQGGNGGWIIDKLGALDFAGGTVVEINSGAAALALAIVLGKREGFKRDAMRPHNIPFILLGAGLLWFGWFGFNAGSALGANGIAGLALINTQVATAAALIGWLLVEKIRDGHATSLGAASGAVAERLIVSNPSVTWPNHTTLVTGVRADKHGVLSNGLIVDFYRHISQGETEHSPRIVTLSRRQLALIEDRTRQNGPAPTISTRAALSACWPGPPISRSTRWRA